MAETMDSLELKIKADATNASAAIDKLVTSLSNLNTSLGSGSFANLTNISVGVNSLANSMMNYKNSGVNKANFTAVAAGMNEIAGVDSDGITRASQAMVALTQNLASVANLKINSAGITEMANAISKLGRQTATQATANIPQFTSQLTTLITELNKITAITFDVTNFTNLANAISKLGGANAQTAIANMSQLGSAMTQLMSTLSQAPMVSQNLIDITNAMANLASSSGRLSTTVNQMNGGFGTIGTTFQSTQKRALSLAAAVGKLYANFWLLLRGIKLIKSAITLSSDLTEIQNVVDKTFGNYASKLDEMAQDSITKYGMSEVALKKFASTFQALGVAMGYSKKDMSDMSVNLTKLTADMASFYNVEQSDVADDLQAIFTGAVKPLRKYGLDLSNATLKEYALSKGLNSNISAMTQAEKTALRYQYVLDHTSDITGDFAQTSSRMCAA